MDVARGPVGDLSSLPKDVRDRIEFLKRNQELAFEVIGRDINYARLWSNCFGTAVHILGVSYPTRIAGRKESTLYLAERPGFIGTLAVDEVLEREFDRVESPEPGDMLVRRFKRTDDPAHGAVITSSEGNIYEIFQQDCCGGPFTSGSYYASKPSGSFFNTFTFHRKK